MSRPPPVDGDNDEDVCPLAEPGLWELYAPTE